MTSPVRRLAVPVGLLVGWSVIVSYDKGGKVHFSGDNQNLGVPRHPICRFTADLALYDTFGCPPTALIAIYIWSEPHI